METQGLYYSKILNIGSIAGNGAFPDVFSPHFAEVADQVTSSLCAPRKGDNFVLGYFSDNELHWPANPIIYYLSFPEGSSAKTAALSFLEANGLSRDSVPSEDVELAFLATVSQQYFSVISEAIKRADPNHLFLGCKLLDSSAQMLIAIAKGSVDGGQHVDVHSIDIYDYTPDVAKMQQVYNAVQIPWLIAEFSFRGNDSGLPNKKGAGPIVPNQAARAQDFTTYVIELLKLPFAVGYHWFEYVDEPAEGRFDGEDSQYGVVNIGDVVYTVITDQMKKINQEAESLHAQAK